MSLGTNPLGFLSDGVRILAGGVAALAAVLVMPGFLVLQQHSATAAVTIGATAFVGGAYAVYATEIARRSRDDESVAGDWE